MVPVDKATLPRPAPHAHRHPTSHVPSPPSTCPPHLLRALPAHHAQLRGLGARRARRRERRSDAGAQRQRPPGVQPGGLCAAASHRGAAAGRCGAWPARLVGGGLVAYGTKVGRTALSSGLGVHTVLRPVFQDLKKWFVSRFMTFVSPSRQNGWRMRARCADRRQTATAVTRAARARTVYGVHDDGPALSPSPRLYPPTPRPRRLTHSPTSTFNLHCVPY